MLPIYDGSKISNVSVSLLSIVTSCDESNTLATYILALKVTPYIEGTVFPDKSFSVNKTPVLPVREQICSKSMTVVALIIY